MESIELIFGSTLIQKTLKNPLEIFSIPNYVNKD